VCAGVCVKNVEFVVFFLHISYKSVFIAKSKKSLWISAADVGLEAGAVLSREVQCHLEGRGVSRATWRVPGRPRSIFLLSRRGFNWSTYSGLHPGDLQGQDTRPAGQGST
jgi:hypothetical protein